MQSSFDRDNYVEILYQNIVPAMHNQFKKEGDNVVSHFGGSYDLSSVMHYSANAFSKNGKMTIRVKVR